MKLGLQAMKAALAGMAGSFTGATKEARGFPHETLDDYRGYQRAPRYRAPRTVGLRPPAPWLPNVKGMRYEKGKLIPRKSQA